MKKVRLLTALMLFCAVNASAQEKYTVNPRSGMENGTVEVEPSSQSCNPGDSAIVYCKPHRGYGMSQGVFYAIRRADGTMSAPQLADNKSTYVDDRANDTQLFKFKMPKGNVEVWAEFVGLRTLIIHQTNNGKISPLYGVNQQTRDSNVVNNVALMPVKLKVTPNSGFKLLDVSIDNIDKRLYKISGSMITVEMPRENDTVHVTPTFGLDHYNVTVTGDRTNVDVTLSNTTPKAREEVTATIVAKEGYIPYNISVKNARNWWREGKPTKLSDGRWQVVYRIKVDLDDVTVKVGALKVYAFSVTDLENSGRLETYIPEVIPDYPGLAAQGQQVPILVELPENYSSTFTAKNAFNETLKPVIYHNALRNSFADEGMANWTETKPGLDEGFSIKVFTDTQSEDNKYWGTSVKNSMSQSVTLADREYPAHAKSKVDNQELLSVAALVSINPRLARKAEAYLVSSGGGAADSLLIADYGGSQEEGWQTVFKTVQVDAKADKLKLHINAEGDDQNKKRSYEGPQFDNLCLLLPAARDTLWNEDVLVFTMGNSPVTISCVPTAHLDTLRVDQQPHATVTLVNTSSGQQGDPIAAVKNDVIVIKGQYDPDYAIYGMTCDHYKKEPSNPNEKADEASDNANASDTSGSGSGDSKDDDSEIDDIDAPRFLGFRASLAELRTATPTSSEKLELDSINYSTRTVYYHMIKLNQDEEIVFKPKVDVTKVNIEPNLGGLLTLSNAQPKTGEEVTITITPDTGCQLRQIRTVPAGVVTITQKAVDATTGVSTHTFIMPSTHLILTPEFVVPISTKEQFEKLNQQYGEFNLMNDLDLGSDWKKYIDMIGDFNGNGHTITYGGTKSLFQTVADNASVRHLKVKANLRAKDEAYIGGIAKMNNGIIEDCVVSGKVRNLRRGSVAAGVAGQIMPKRDGKAIVSHCHVLCSTIDGSKACGIAWQEEGVTITENLFTGKFAYSDGCAYIISNPVEKSTVTNNYYVENDKNKDAMSGSGVTTETSDHLLQRVKELSADYPVFAASIRDKYATDFAIVLDTTDIVGRNALSAVQAGAGTVISASVRVYGNNHLTAITVSDSDGSDAQNCPFTDNMDNIYAFSFTMPNHDVKVTFQTQEGRYIYTAQQLNDIDEKDGIFYLARDLELKNWQGSLCLRGKLYGRGHTIKYNAASDKCRGLFRTIHQNALLQGLRVVGIVETTINCAGIANENNGTIRDCHFTGRITRIPTTKPKKPVANIAAIVYQVGETSVVDHCSATGELICAQNADAVKANPLCPQQTDVKLDNCNWISATPTEAECQELRTLANAAMKDYPVYARGILDKIDPYVVTGHDTIRVKQGTTLDVLTLTDGEPFVCSADVKVNRIVYKRKATTGLEQWILPFEFKQLAGNGSFEYSKVREGDDKMPELYDTKTLSLTQQPTPITYKANEIWMFEGKGSEYVLTNDGAPINVKPTHNYNVGYYKSIKDIANFYATYDSIPAKAAKDNLLYVWNSATGEFASTEDSDIQILPFRFYLQFYNEDVKHEVKYTQTEWAKSYPANSTNKAPRRISEVMADGWQPVFLDPRQPQSITARMLDNYEVACLVDVDGETFDSDTGTPLTAVSLGYQVVNSRIDLPSALPLLVRAKRSDAEPLVSDQMGNEIETLYEQYMIDDEKSGTTNDFDMPHYWCASMGNRLDVWHLPASESYSELAGLGCMMFEDNYFDQSFLYASKSDTRTTAPMSYCLTVYNTDTYELLPLLGNRVSIEFIELQEEATGINTVKGEGFMVHDSQSYNLNGQRVGAGYKGIIVKNGQKMIKR